MERFKIIDGGKPKAEQKDEYEQVICRQCNGSNFIESTLAPMYHKNKIVGGTPVLVCLHCLLRGTIVDTSL